MIVALAHQNAIGTLGQLAQGEQGVVVLQYNFPRAVGADHGVEQECRRQVISKNLRDNESSERPGATAQVQQHIFTTMRFWRCDGLRYWPAGPHSPSEGLKVQRETRTSKFKERPANNAQHNSAQGRER